MRTNSQAAAPPTWLDFQVYRLVKVEQYTTRGAAESLGISQTRVCQVLAKVGDFLLETAPASVDEADLQKQLHVSMQIAAERLEYLQRQAVSGFRRSQKTTRKLSKQRGEDGEPQFDEETSAGDPRFLMVAARLTLMAAKLPTAQLDSLALQGYALADDDEAANADSAEHEQDKNHSEVGCSPASQQAANRSPLPTEMQAAIAELQMSSAANPVLELLSPVPSKRTVQRGSRPESNQQRRDEFFGQ